jgi:hypothetical protein
MIFAGSLPASCEDAPALPFYDWGACPYETCQYTKWTAHRAVTMYDTWKEGRQAVAQLREGEQVTGMKGVVITLLSKTASDCSFWTT